MQTSVVELLRQLQADQGIAYLFISHDLAVVRSLSHRVGVLYLGELCEVGTAEEVYAPTVRRPALVSRGLRADAGAPLEPRADLGQRPLRQAHRDRRLRRDRPLPRDGLQGARDAGLSDEADAAHDRGEPLDRLLGSDGLHELLSASDYVVVTTSLNSSTRHLLGEAEFRALKPGVGIVNIARGGVIDQDALLAALDDGRVGGAVLDTVTPQPLPAESPLWSHRRVIVTPHISGGSPEGWRRSMDLFVANLPRYLDRDRLHLGGLVDVRDHL